jgi:hypothetical protein
MDNWILMGDIISSGKSDPIKLLKEFSLLIEEVNDEFKNETKSPLTITLGDEFQGVITDLNTSLEIIVRIEEKKWELNHPLSLRYSLGFGEISTQINPKIAHGMLGMGLTTVREALNELKKEDDRIVLVGKIDKKETIRLVVSLFLDKQNQWNWKDKAIISGYLQGKDYKQVAHILEKDSSSIWRKFKSLGFKSYEKHKMLIKLLAKDEY